MISGTIARGLPALCCLVVCACAGRPHIQGAVDPVTLIDDDALAAAAVTRARATAWLDRAIARTSTDACAVGALKDERPERTPDATSDRFDRLSALATSLCAAGIEGAEPAFAESGEMRVAIDEHARRGSEAYFVDPGFTGVAAFEVVESAAPEPLASPPRGTCQGEATFSVAEFQVLGNLVANAVLRSNVPMRIGIESNGSDECLYMFYGATEITVPLPMSAGRYRVFVSPDHPTPGFEVRADFHFGEAPPDVSTVVWLTGTPQVRRGVVDRADVDLSSMTPDCYGWVADRPSHVAIVSQQQWGEVRVQSDADPILYMRGPSGEELCNDDFDGLNPGLDVNLSPGVWEVYVGSYGEAESFPYDITFGP